MKKFILTLAVLFAFATPTTASATMMMSPANPASPLSPSNPANPASPLHNKDGDNKINFSKSEVLIIIGIVLAALIVCMIIFRKFLI